MAVLLEYLNLLLSGIGLFQKGFPETFGNPPRYTPAVRRIP